MTNDPLIKQLARVAKEISPEEDLKLIVAALEKNRNALFERLELTSPDFDFLGIELSAETRLRQWALAGLMQAKEFKSDKALIKESIKQGTPDKGPNKKEVHAALFIQAVRCIEMIKTERNCSLRTAVRKIKDGSHGINRSYEWIDDLIGLDRDEDNIVQTAKNGRAHFKNYISGKDVISEFFAFMKQLGLEVETIPDKLLVELGFNPKYGKQK